MNSDVWVPAAADRPNYPGECGRGSARAGNRRYYEDLSRSVADLGSRSTDAGDLTIIKARFQGAFDQVVTAVDQVNAIYDELSTQNLNPTTLLYTVTAPFSMRTQRALSLRDRRSVRDIGLHGELFPRPARLPASRLLST